jgi:UDP-3-O-[3-hydroxymyristoyl] glucosamine N-acyltransferase
MRIMRQTTRRITRTTMIKAVSSTTRRTAAMNPWKKIDSKVPPLAGRPAPGSEASGDPGSGVLVGVGVKVGVSVGVGDGVMVGVSVGVGDGVMVGVSVGVGDGVTVGVSVGVGNGVWVGGTDVGCGRRVLVGSG